MNWLFLRGLLREKRHWLDFPEFFESQVSRSKVYLLDHPGVGDAESASFPKSIEAWVHYLRQEWKALEVDLSRPSCIIGHSLGGMLALKWAEMHPQDFKGLVAINTSAANKGYFWQRLRVKNLASLLKLQFIKDPYQREKLILSLITGIRKKDPSVIQAWADIAKAPEQQKKLAVKQLKIAMNYKVPSRILTPSLFLAAKLDQFTDYRCSKSLAKHLKAQYREHAFAGHDLCLDAPEWVCSKVGDFVKNLEEKQGKG